MLLNNYLDMSKDRPEFENWIPFEFTLSVEGEEYKFIENGTCFTEWETKKFINGFEELIKIFRVNEKNDISAERFTPFVHTCCEVYFDIKIFDEEDDLIGIELWINMAFLNHFGYKKGFCFSVNIDDFEKFAKEINNQYYTIKEKCNY